MTIYFRQYMVIYYIYNIKTPVTKLRIKHRNFFNLLHLLMPFVAKMQCQLILCVQYASHRDVFLDWRNLLNANASRSVLIFITTKIQFVCHPINLSFNPQLIIPIYLRWQSTVAWYFMCLCANIYRYGAIVPNISSLYEVCCHGYFAKMCSSLISICP